MNVIILVNDSLRLDHVGCYNDVIPTCKYHNGRAVETPNLDKFSKHSARFTHCFPENLPTLPMRTGVINGRYNFPFRGWQRVEPTDILLSEILWDKGYKSCFVTDTYHMHKPSNAYERGFDEVIYVRGQEEDPVVVDKSIPVDVTSFYKTNGTDKRMLAQTEQYLRNISKWSDPATEYFCAQVIDNAVEWLKRQKKRDNLFMWVDCFDPHEPWDPPAPYDAYYTDPNFKGTVVKHPIPGPTDGYMTPEEVQYTKALYAGLCSFVDKWDGVFLNSLREMGMLENTLVVFISDHGEPFGEHGIIRKALPLPYEELARIPFMIHHPEGIGAGQTFNQLVQNIDITPTILDFLGINTRFFKFHGKSLLPIMKGEQDKIRDYAYVGHYNQSCRINDHEYAYFHYMIDRAPELYRYAEDKDMRNNLIDKEPAKAEALKQEMFDFVKKLGGPDWAEMAVQATHKH